MNKISNYLMRFRIKFFLTIKWIYNLIFIDGKHTFLTKVIKNDSEKAFCKQWLNDEDFTKRL